jgi:pimeloyl-ACP methyl ester carboxylesterase
VRSRYVIRSLIGLSVVALAGSAALAGHNASAFDTATKVRSSNRKPPKRTAAKKAAPKKAAPNKVAPNGGSEVPASTSATIASALPPTPVVWDRCRDSEFECGDVSVPLDYTKPSGRKITLSLVKISAPKSTRIGSMLVNPGGPGASGRLFARQLATNDTVSTLRKHFDVIGFDPRGVASTIPIQCATPAQYDEFFAADPNPDDEAEFQALAATNRAFAKRCAEQNADVLPFVATSEVVRDMDSIRAALGESTISFLGFSYGTYLGAKYAEAYPQRVRAFVLDGVLDPTADSDERVRKQAIGFEEQLNAFLKSCETKKCGFIKDGETPGQGFDRVMGKLERAPVAVGKRSLGPGEAWLGALAALYNSNTGWASLRSALTNLDDGSGEVLLRLSDAYTRRTSEGTYSNITDANVAVNCLDSPSNRDPEHYRRLATEFASFAPRFGAFAAYSSMICASWTLPATGSLAPLKFAAPVPVLLIGTTGDPATPFIWAKNVRGQIPGSSLLILEGDGHTAILTGNGCIRSAVQQFLIERIAPAGETVCR